MFEKRNFINLQRLVLAKNHIFQVDEKAFNNLKNLDGLDLSHNNLTRVPTFSTFASISQLRELDLSGNPVGPTLFGFSFKGLRNLVSLKLRSCNIHTIQTRAFNSLRNLQWVELDDNVLSVIHPLAMEPIQATLHGIGLQGNPWNCTCQLLDFRKWMVDYNIPYNAMPPSCHSPTRLSQKNWDEITIHEFACPPQILFAGNQDLMFS